MSPQAPRSSARLLAPLALVACGLAVLVLLAASMAGDDSPDGGSAPTTANQPASDTTTTPTTEQRASYTVQPGDTLGAISEETGVPIETIELLNPELDPQALIAGQKIKLRE